LDLPVVTWWSLLAPHQVKDKLKALWNDLDDAVKDDFVRIAVKNGFKKHKP